MAEDKPRAFWAEGLEPKERARLAIQAQKLIADQPSETYRRDMDIRNVRLYENNPSVTLFSFAGKYYSESNVGAVPPPEQSVNNKAKAMIDTMASQIFTTDQRARCRTVDGNWRQRRRARYLQNFADGLAFELKLHQLRKRAGMDAAILESGKGLVQFYIEDGRVKGERCLATEFSVDLQDGLVDGMPQTMYRVRPIARERLRRMVEDERGEDKDRKLKAIEAAEQVNVPGAPGDYVLAWEAVHLPSSKDAKDGWHVVAVEKDDGDLVVESYEKPFYPWVPFSTEDRFTGTWGNSLMTQARPLQVRINLNEYRKQKMLKLFHAGHLYVDRAANIRPSQLTNEIGSVIEGDGPTPPQYMQVQAITAEMDETIKIDGDLIFANAGINVGASTGASQLGANAPAAAMREETAKGDQRNSPRQQRWEQFHLDCMRVALSLVRDIVTAKKSTDKSHAHGYRVAAPGKRGLTATDWKDVQLDEDDYVLEIKPASPVPTDPDALVALGERMVELKAWSPDQLASYMQDLDADARTNRRAAQERLLEKQFEGMLYEAKFAAVPNEFTDVKLALQMGAEYLAQGEEDGVPDKHQERVRRFLKKCVGLMPPPPAPSGPPGAGAPPMQGAAPPMAA